MHSYKYLEGLRPALMTEVSIPGEDTKVLDGYVSVHIRRGDFVSSATEQLVGIEWYSAAIAAMDDAMGPLTPLVFTDDIEWVAKNLRLPGGRQVEFGSSIRSSPVEDFQYMRRCASHIVSRSTFSWWAAWCRHDPSGLVIAPSGWQYAEVAIDDDIYPPDWTRLSAARV